MLMVFAETINDLSFYELTKDLNFYNNEKDRKKAEKFWREPKPEHLARHRQVFDWIYLRCRLSEAQNHRCCWCQKLTTDKRGRDNSSTVEHYIPRCKGGTDDPDNLVMACSKCNSKRGSHEPEVFLEYINNGKKLPKIHNQPSDIKLKRKMLHKILYDPQTVWC